MRLPFSPRPKPLVTSDMLAEGRFIRRIMPKSRKVASRADPTLGWVRPRPYKPEMAGSQQIFVACLASVAALSLAPGAALAQNDYGLSRVAPYNGRVGQPTTDLGRVSRPGKPLPTDGNTTGKAVNEPVVTIHAFGGVMVGGSVGK